MNNDQIESLNLHFVLCMERTGSSMLTMMFNRNKDIISPSEEPFVLYMYREYGCKTVWTERDIDRFLIQFERLAEKNLTLYFSPLSALREKMMENKDHLDFQKLIRLIYSLFLPLLKKEEFNHIIDKQIKYILYTSELEELSPDSKFIVLVRDPRSVVASWKKRGLGLSNHIAYMAKLWQLNYEAVHTDLTSKPEKYLLVHYEDLVLNNKETLLKICEFLKITFREEMLSHHDLPTPDPLSMEVVKRLPQDFVERLMDFHRNTLSPLNDSLINEWKKSLSDQEVKLIESITRETASQYGYHFSAETYRLSIKERLAVAFAFWEKKVYLQAYVKSPLWLKSLVKRFRPNVRKE